MFEILQTLLLLFYNDQHLFKFIFKLETQCMKTHALEGTGLHSAWPALYHSLGTLKGGRWSSDQGRLCPITPLLLPLPAAQSSAGPGYLSLGWPGQLGSCQMGFAYSLVRPWVAGRLRELGNSGGSGWASSHCSSEAEGTGHYHFVSVGTACHPWGHGSQLAYFFF